MKFDFPLDLSPASVDEREQFYREEFPGKQLEEKMERWDVFVPVVDVGSESTLYRPRFKEYKDKLVRMTDYGDMDDLKDRIVEFAPEDLYYVTTVEKEDRIETNPEQELVFDLDPEMVECERCERKKKYLEGAAREYVFCEECFKQVARETRQLYSFLQNHFSDLRLVYSGRGFHIHVEDESAFAMDREDRRELAGKAAKEFPIDRKITAGEKDLIRMPGSLHGLVSRVVTEVEVSDLNRPLQILESRAVPRFVKEDVGTG
ncbi:MAG: DNA primase small subunit domain-containing protein [Candidatus Nanohaloarchaea archaeon]|nr:DNA primase small subunit domain-containing protein [Candidatus Nanohaloarchaea archaeon]